MHTNDSELLCKMAIPFAFLFDMPDDCAASGQRQDGAGDQHQGRHGARHRYGVELYLAAHEIEKKINPFNGFHSIDKVRQTTIVNF